MVYENECETDDQNWYVENQRVKVPAFVLLYSKYVGNIGSGRTKLRHMKCVMQAIERIASMGVIKNDRDVWDLEHTKLLCEKVGDKHLLSEFGGRNQNSEMYRKKIYNNMKLAKAFDSNRNDTVVC